MINTVGAAKPMTSPLTKLNVASYVVNANPPEFVNVQYLKASLAGLIFDVAIFGWLPTVVEA